VGFQIYEQYQGVRSGIDPIREKSIAAERSHRAGAPKMGIEGGSRPHKTAGATMSQTPHSATNPAGKPRSKVVVHDLKKARQMLPLVASIVNDLVQHRRLIRQLTPEQEELFRNRRHLDWGGRQRRYRINEEIAAAERSFADALGELQGLGVQLVDDTIGEVDFPTKILGRPAAFSWRLGENSVSFWHYQGETMRRPIPSEWEHGVPTTANRPAR